jgi:hypothetical protein
MARPRAMVFPIVRCHRISRSGIFAGAPGLPRHARTGIISKTTDQVARAINELLSMQAALCGVASMTSARLGAAAVLARRGDWSES